MKSPILGQGKYCIPTAEGVYHFIQQPPDELFSQLLAFLFSINHSISLNATSLQQKLNINAETLAALLERAQQNNWLRAETTKASLTGADIDELLSHLSHEGKTLLTDTKGFCLGNAGFSEDRIDVLSAMGAEIADLYQKYRSVMSDETFVSPAWGMLDSQGHALLGIWRLQVVDNVFYLLIEGEPELANTAFVQLVWLLHYRYHQREIINNQK